MEKKSLGRGLEDISNVFLSQHGKTEKPHAPSLARPREALCRSCRNYIERPFEPPRCRVFGDSNGEKNGARPDPIAMNHVGYCQHFAALPPQEESVLSGCAKEDLPAQDAHYEVEETISVQRKISFPPDEDSQVQIKKALAEHLEAGFSITTIELNRVGERAELQHSIRRDKVILCVKDLPPA